MKPAPPVSSTHVGSYAAAISAADRRRRSSLGSGRAGPLADDDDDDERVRGQGGATSEQASPARPSDLPAPRAWAAGPQGGRAVGGAGHGRLRPDRPLLGGALGDQLP